MSCAVRGEEHPCEIKISRVPRELCKRHRHVLGHDDLTPAPHALQDLVRPLVLDRVQGVADDTLSVVRGFGPQREEECSIILLVEPADVGVHAGHEVDDVLSLLHQVLG